MEAEAATVTDPALLDDYAAQKRKQAYRRGSRRCRRTSRRKPPAGAHAVDGEETRAEETPAMGLPGTEADPATLWRRRERVGMATW